MRAASGHPDAIVVGSGANALGALRALGRSGLTSWLVTRDGSDLALRSRFAARRLVLPRDEELEPQRLAGLLGIGRRPALLLTEELDVKQCLAEAPAWQRLFSSWFFTPSVAAALMSKARFCALAEETAAPAPRTRVIARADNLEELEGLSFPVVVKPAVRDPSYSSAFAKAYRFDDEQTLRNRLSALLDPGVPLVVQEWIVGSDTDLYFTILYVDEAGEEDVSFVGRKLLCWPPEVGGTAACVGAPEAHEELTALTRKFVRSVGFRGLIGMEYKRDSRTGRFIMVEPTVYRTDYQHEVAAISGCDLLAQACRAAAGGRSLRQPAYHGDRCWMDFPASRYAASVSGPVPDVHRVDAYFRWTDPLPGIIHRARFLRASLAARWRAVVDRGGAQGSRA